MLKGWFIAVLAGDSYVARLGGGWLIWTWGGAVIIGLAYTLRGPCKQLHIYFTFRWPKIVHSEDEFTQKVTQSLLDLG